MSNITKHTRYLVSLHSLRFYFIWSEVKKTHIELLFLIFFIKNPEERRREAGKKKAANNDNMEISRREKIQGRKG